MLPFLDNGGAQVRARSLIVAAIAVIPLLVAGCGDKSSQSGVEPTTLPQTSSASTSFEAKVYLRDFNEECRKVPCWQPTQFEPRLVERESVSLVEKGPDEEDGPQVGWPMDDDTVLVQCIAKGGKYQNENGQLINDWYGIVVPIDKLEPKAKGDPRLVEVEGGYRAYVGISWLRGGEDIRLLPC